MEGTARVQLNCSLAQGFIVVFQVRSCTLHLRWFLQASCILAYALNSYVTLNITSNKIPRSCQSK
jgi:hypothetical protein